MKMAKKKSDYTDFTVQEPEQKTELTVSKEPLIRLQDFKATYDVFLVDEIKFAKKYSIRVGTSVDGTVVSTLLGVYDTNKNEYIFRDEGPNGDNNYVEILYKKGTIEIKFVYIRTRQICTRSVAYTMKALLRYINDRSLYAPMGKVYIKSRTAAAAFNCYNRAFELNGYKVNEEELEDFKEKYRQRKGEMVVFTFKNFENPDQILKSTAPKKRKVRLRF